jgi:hypothetical protein
MSIAPHFEHAAEDTSCSATRPVVNDRIYLRRVRWRIEAMERRLAAVTWDTIHLANNTAYLVCNERWDAGGGSCNARTKGALMQLT